MHKLSNDHLTIGILPLGAELRSVINNITNKEYIWQADPSVWNRSSPVLFPFVGRLKNDQYSYMGKTYHLPQHGFARNYNFEVIHQTENELTFELEADESTLENYPFHFNLQLKYTLDANCLNLEYRVENTGSEIMYFSLGAHPAFVLNDDIDSYSIAFEKEEQFNRHLLDAGLRNQQSEIVPMQGNILPLKKDFFENDAIVIKGMQSNVLSLINKHQQKVISLEANDYPYYGIWAKSPFPFVCLEPWDGIADSINATSELTEKEGIRSLASTEVVFRRLAFRFF